MVKQILINMNFGIEKDDDFKAQGKKNLLALVVSCLEVLLKIKPWNISIVITVFH